MSELPTVVYIGGAGRSGSTLLDNLLGSSSGWFSTGELRLFWNARQLWTHRCGCGVALRDCALWSAVLDDLGPVDLEWAAAMERRVLRGRQAWRLLRPDVLGRADDTVAFVDLMARFGRSIATVTGADVLVDSSKSPVGLGVWAAAGATVVPVLLVRDPRAVAWSWQRATTLGRRASAAAAAEWMLSNAAMEVAGRRAGRTPVLVRYDDLVLDPGQTVSVIAEHAGAPHAAATSGTTATLAPNHTVAGNPSRFRTGPVDLRNDDEWRARLRRRDRAVATALTFPLLRRYGYPFRP